MYWLNDLDLIDKVGSYKKNGQKLKKIIKKRKINYDSLCFIISGHKLTTELHGSKYV